MKLELVYSEKDLQIFDATGEIDFSLNSDINTNQVKDLLNRTVTDFTLKNNSISYWLMQISERNSLVNNLFLDLSYITLIEKYLTDKVNIKVYTNNISIFSYYNNFAKITYKSKLIFLYKKTLIQLRPYKTLLVFVLNSVLFYYRFVQKNNAKCLEDTVIIETYAGVANFKKDQFKDSYFGDLAELLRSTKGKKVLTWISFDKRPFLPLLYFSKRSVDKYTKDKFDSYLDFIRNNQDKFLLMEDYLTFFDYWMAIIHFFKKRFFAIRSFDFQDIRLKQVFLHYCKKEHVEYASLFYSFIKRLKENQSNNLTFLISFENLHNQKAIMLGVQKYLENSKVIGSFHTSKPDNLLSLEFSSYLKTDHVPKPELIVFNSNSYLEAYRKFNIPSINGYAFRQESIKNISFHRNSFDEKTLLILFSGDSKELIWQVPLLKEIPKGFKILVKFHPFYQFDLDDIWERNNYEIIQNNSLANVLSKRPKVLSTYSMLALECTTLGLDVGLAYNKKRLIFNPFDSTNIKNYSLISNPEEMKNFLNKERRILNPVNFFNLSEKNKSDLLDIF